MYIQYIQRYVNVKLRVVKYLKSQELHSDLHWSGSSVVENRSINVQSIK